MNADKLPELGNFSLGSPKGTQTGKWKLSTMLWHLLTKSVVVLDESEMTNINSSFRKDLSGMRNSESLRQSINLVVCELLEAILELTVTRVSTM